LLLLNNRYIPLERLGSGGFATIYTVWHLQKKTERVLKVMVDTSPKALQLFEQEAAVLARLEHPGVPKVEKDSYFFVNLGNSQERSLPCLVTERHCRMF
jgi:serine/threonine protein kinase